MCCQLGAQNVPMNALVLPALQTRTQHFCFSEGIRNALVTGPGGYTTSLHQ